MPFEEIYSAALLECGRGGLSLDIGVDLEPRSGFDAARFNWGCDRTLGTARDPAPLPPPRARGIALPQSGT